MKRQQGKASNHNEKAAEKDRDETRQRRAGKRRRRQKKKTCLLQKEKRVRDGKEGSPGDAPSEEERGEKENEPPQNKTKTKNEGGVVSSKLGVVERAEKKGIYSTK